MKTARNLCLIIILVTVFSLQAVFAEDGTKLGSNLEDWTYTEDTNSITLSHLKLTSGTSADVVVPGEFAGHEGKQVYLESNKANNGGYNPLWGDGMSPKVTSLIIGDSTHKVKVKDGDATSLFYSLESMKTIDVSALDTSDIVNMKEMFYDCTAVENIVGLNTWDTHNCESMDRTFYKLTSYTGSLDVSTFNTSKVKSMSSMFRGAFSNINVSNFDTSNVTDMSNMFNACSAVTSLDLSSFTTGNVEKMEWMFWACGKLESVNLSSFNTAKVTTMQKMFYNNYALKAVDLSTFDTSSVTDMSLQKMLTTGCTQTMRQHQSRYPSQNGRKLA